MSLIALRRRAAPVAALTLAGFFTSLLQAGRSLAQQAPEGTEPPVMISLPELEAAGHVPATSSASPAGAVSSSSVGRAPVQGNELESEAATRENPGSENASSAPVSVGSVGSSSPSASGPATATSPVAATATPVTASVPTTTRALPTGGDKSGVTSKAISVPKGAGTITGMGESFSAQLSTGIASFSVPFALPSARGGAQPSLGLSYSSSGGAGIAGAGWEVGVPFIARQTDRGIPKYDDKPGVWHAEQDRFVFNGGQELVPICVVSPSKQCTGALLDVQILPEGSTPIDESMPAWSAGWQYFRARVEGSFLRFFWSPNHRTWRVQDKSGITMELGVPLNEPSYPNALETNPDKPSEIYTWHLIRQYDAYGSANPATGAPQPVNVVVYRYLPPAENGGMAYLSDIFWTPPATNPAVAGLETYAHHARLAYEPRTDPTSSYRSGWKIEQRSRLQRVDVASKSFNGSVSSSRELVRRYHLSYDPAYHVSLLAQVQVEGRCAQPVAEQSGVLAASGCPKLPAMRFEYSHVKPFTVDGKPGSAKLAGYEAFDERVRELANSPDHSVDEELTDLFDINVDGLPDVLVTAPGLYGSGHGVFFNGTGGVADRFGAVERMSVHGVAGVDAGTLTLRNLNVAALDLDGDASVDLLHMPAVNKYSVYRPARDGKNLFWEGREVTTASGQSPKLDFGRDTLDIHVVDVDVDGLVDLVRTTGTELQTFFSLGRYPKGDGQFGFATMTRAAAADIVNDPVRTCVPWSATPVRFSDSDIKLGDMNGDGIVDIVRQRRGDIIYWPGRGNGYWGTGKRDDCAAGTFGEDRHVTMSASPHYSDIQGDSIRLDDVNGDGLDDLVQVRFSEVDVWLNVDGASWTDRHILRGTPESPSYANRVRLVDVNGSGTRDILWGNAKKYRYIDLAGGERPWVLTGVDNGLGKTTTIEYSTSTAEMLAAEATGKPCAANLPWSGAWCSFAPSVLHVVKRVTENANLKVAGIDPRPQITEYSYRDPIYDGQQREFRGFSRARARRLGDANSPTDVTETAFLLGSCVDEEPGDAVNPCTPAESWRDNPREALKGLPVLTEKFDEQGQYLSTDHTTYRLRQLYTGLDGRAVRHAFEVKKRQYLYDTDTPAVPATSWLGGSELHAISVETERTLGTVAPAASSPAPILRKPARAAELRSEVVVDPFGNRIDAIARGCTGGQACPEPDEVITTRTVPAVIDPAASGWIWRTVKGYVTGESGFGAAHGVRRGETLTTYNAQGDPTETQAVLAGTVPLLRSRVPTGAIAPNPGEASQDSTSLTLAEQTYDAFGNLVNEAGANGRCREIGYDEQYEALPISETIHAGEYTRTAELGFPGSCGSTELHTTAMYDRGFELVVQTTDMQDRVTRIAYDGFGRLSTLTRPRPGPDPPLDPQNPNVIPSLSAAPSVKVSYFLPSDLGPGARHSLIHTEAQDGADHDDAANYLESWSYVDGFGRTIATLSEADPAAGDDAPWIIGGLSVHDSKGALERKYLDAFASSAGNAFSFSSPSGQPAATVSYDAFGRQVETHDIDGTITLNTRYHALSADHWDTADLFSGLHGDTPATERKDGHGRSVYAIERYHQNTEARATRTGYLPSGEVEFIKRMRFTGGIEIAHHLIPPDAGAAETVVRWMRYDTLGRMVLNVEPNTSPDFTISKEASADGLRAWRYAYNDAGDLVGTSDARGCGVNYRYDGAGRLLHEDYSPCLGDTHAVYSDPNLSGGTGLEVVYLYDGTYGGTLPSWATLPPGYAAGSNLLKGRIFAVFDRASSTFTTYDGRGRLTRADMRVAKPSKEVGAPPGAADDSLASRYASRWYAQKAAYDAADRVVAQTTGATTTNVQGIPLPSGPLAGETSAVRTHYTRRGTVKNVNGSYNDLVRSIDRTADGLVEKIVYGDAAHSAQDPGTRTHFFYDQRRRLDNVITYRDPPAAWSNPGSYTPSPSPGGTPTTFQIWLQDDQFIYDEVSNPTEIIDNRAITAAEWPDGAKPANREIEYDNLYRVKRIDYTYPSGSDEWESPFEVENEGTSADPRRARPVPHVEFDQRLHWQTFNYDWQGNTSSTDDDAHGFYDRSLGTVTSGAPTAGPNQLQTASNLGTGPRDGSLATAYDVAGNLTRLNVRRNGECASGECSQRYAYDWDEVGRLVRARRWDVATAAIGQPTDALPPHNERDADLSYLYDAGDQRIVKAAREVESSDRQTLYLFESLELRRTFWVDSGGNAEYELSDETEVPYLFANGMRLGRVVLEGTDDDEPRVGGARLHVFLELGDHLGSASIVLDQATGELVERSTYQAYGGAETDYRPERWEGFREDYRFTGKEEDVEVGLQYFGKRFYAPLLQRWISPDPLTIHALGGDLNVYAYVSGEALRATDPLGLETRDIRTEYKDQRDQLVKAIKETQSAAELAEKRGWDEYTAKSGTSFDWWMKANELRAEAETKKDQLNELDLRYGALEGLKATLGAGRQEAITQAIRAYDQTVEEIKASGAAAIPLVAYWVYKEAKGEKRSAEQMQQDTSRAAAVAVVVGVVVATTTTRLRGPTIHPGEHGSGGGRRPPEHQVIVEERLKARNKRREAQSRAENGQTVTGEGQSRDHDSARRGPAGQRPQGPSTRHGRQRNIGIDEEHHRRQDPHLGIRR